MNPQSTALPAAPRIANDVATPAPAVHAAAAPTTQGTNMVANIPVHVQKPQAAPATPANEDDELDQIMHDVGQELKKDDKKLQKHGLLDFLHKPKPLVKAPAPPVKQQIDTAAPAPLPINQPMPQESQPVTTTAIPQTKPQAPVAAKPKAQRSIPVFVIFVALCVTGFLVAAAIAAYRQS